MPTPADLTLTTEQLRQFPIFGGLTDDDLRLLLPLMRPMRYTQGEPIISDGDEGDTMYVVVEGEVEVSKRMTLRSTGTGDGRKQEKTIIRMPAEQHPVVGEMGIFNRDSRRIATVSAAKPSLVAELNRDELLTFMERHPAIGYRILLNIVRTVSKRLAKANEDILKLTTAFTLALER